MSLIKKLFRIIDGPVLKLRCHNQIINNNSKDYLILDSIEIKKWDLIKRYKIKSKKSNLRRKHLSIGECVRH